MTEKRLEIVPLQEWGLPDTEKPLVIAGPCSAETEEQVLETARQLKETGRVTVYRAGIWKPRTRPNAFEGVGSKGLPWLQKVKRETGLLVSTEVANIKHVYEALKFGIDILWIGARTSANPFAMQEIADALKGVDIPVLVKNPIIPDLELWIGAIERISNAGISRIGAIHRGFANYEKTIYRNLPHWQIPIDLKYRIPSIPLINDPSHISGNAELIYDLSQQAMDLNFDGLIIESHIRPHEAWSDARQQVTPARLAELLNRLIIRQPLPGNKKTLDELGELRKIINILDDQLLVTLEQRMKVAQKIGHYKKKNNITILQNKRWEDIIRKMLEKGKQKGLRPETINKIFKAIHQESINHQVEIMKNGNRKAPYSGYTF
ncbi:MAG: bifunctional 3-deoxy-7-phosphoheptulonate synthase/chorismate mutase type II [Chlorobi bacterium]|nr:bifunctional 3-deoxy-7-phosphoheptulonate synthase/chorismate mutase type II [Chlorobiota bacterium]